jgi:hypothetical protein
MTPTNLLCIGLGILAVPSLTAGTDDTIEAPITEPIQEPGFFRLDPTFHVRIALGDTTMPWTGQELGGHDPKNDGFNLQGIEVGTNLHIGEHVSGFATVNIFKPRGEDFDAEWEEGFLKLHDLPFGLELRGGRMLTRFGSQNANHLHAWDFVDNNMTNIRFLGEDGFAFEGGELTWLLPTPIEDALSIGFGSAVVPDHDHGGEESHAGHDHAHEAELARPENNVIVARYQAQFGPDDFNQFKVGGSYLTGDNGFGKTTDIYGADFTYTWRENGLESGGRQFRWRNDWMMRDVANDEGGFSDNGFNTALLWEFIETWEAGIRYGYLEGVADPELPQRHRISPVFTKYFRFPGDKFALIRLQYNHDDIKGHDSEDSIWLQLGFDWGPGEVR